MENEESKPQSRGCVCIALMTELYNEDPWTLLTEVEFYKQDQWFGNQGNICVHENRMNTASDRRRIHHSQQRGWGLIKAGEGRIMAQGTSYKAQLSPGGWEHGDSEQS